jgi:hypothetical protein
VYILTLCKMMRGSIIANEWLALPTLELFLQLVLDWQI